MNAGSKFIIKVTHNFSNLNYLRIVSTYFFLQLYRNFSFNPCKPHSLSDPKEAKLQNRKEISPRRVFFFFFFFFFKKATYW